MFQVHLLLLINHLLAFLNPGKVMYMESTNVLSRLMVFVDELIYFLTIHATSGFKILILILEEILTNALSFVFYR